MNTNINEDDIGIYLSEADTIKLSLYSNINDYPNEKRNIAAQNFCDKFSKFLEDLKQNKKAEMIDSEYSKTKWIANDNGDSIHLTYTDITDSKDEMSIVAEVSDKARFLDDFNTFLNEMKKDW